MAKHAVLGQGWIRAEQLLICLPLCKVALGSSLAPCRANHTCEPVWCDTNAHTRPVFSPVVAQMNRTLSSDFMTVSVCLLHVFKVLLTERLEEGLMVLRRMFQWHMIDMVYFTLNETKTGERRWDSKPVINRPSFDSLPEKARRRARMRTSV